MPAPKPSSTSTRTAITPMACWRRPRWWSARARASVGTLALTDHDTIAGLAEARAACAPPRIRFVPGVELSANWRGQTIHIVGLQVDESHAGFNSHLDAVLAAAPGRA